MRPSLLLLLALGACAEAPFASKQPAPAAPAAPAPSATQAAAPSTPVATSADQVDLKDPCVTGMAGNQVICAAAKGTECLVYEGRCYRKKPSTNAAPHP